ncbi:MAG: archease [Flavobacteriaceae bacterium]|nr:archease [Flavobacteriaceae bacterium]
MNIRFLAHTADVRMELEGKSLQELYTLAVKGMGEILKKDFCTQSNNFSKNVTVDIHASDYTNLLIDFLSDVLSISYVEKAIFCSVHILEFSEYNIKAEIKGSDVKMFDEEIKAVTYHEANVYKDKEDQIWKTCIIFDI